MTSDRMQDVFPIEFEFVKGEQPTAEKLTGFVKQTNYALARMTGTVGDPLDYQSHSGTGGVYDLSPENLAQANIARVLGPSDYLSPRGGCFNEKIASTITVTLSANRNSWNLGFPLVKLSGAHVDPTTSFAIYPLAWGTDITTTSTVLLNRVATADLVDSDGDFYVDFYGGTIISHQRSSSSITLIISNMNMLGPGVPWGTHNVIPAWDDVDSFLAPVFIGTAGGTDTWRMDFPTVQYASRKGIASNLKGRLDTAGASSVTFTDLFSSGGTSLYRMPNQLVDNLVAGNELPEGFAYLWDEDTSRVLPIVTFKYFSANAITIEVPEGFVLADGSYRLIIVGVSAAENISFLNTVARENNHIGLSYGQGLDTVFYTPPISHDNLTELYSGSYGTTYSSYIGLDFRKSVYPTNPHPQYLHRYGWMVNDKTGNSGNAMRGDLVFTSVLAAGDEYSADLGYLYSSNSLYFGSNPESTSPTKIRMFFDGGENKKTWVYGSPAVRYAFDYATWNVDGSTSYKGALVVDTTHGQPLYLTNAKNSFLQTAGAAGAVLGFDYANYHELNYVKLCMNYAGATERSVQPMHYSDGQSNSSLSTSPGLKSSSVHQRISLLQTREYRFRAGSYNPLALNIENSIGSSGFPSTNDGTQFSVEYDVYSTSNVTHKITLEETDPRVGHATGDVAEEFIVGRQVRLIGDGFNSSTYYSITAVSFNGTRTEITISGSITTKASTTAKLSMKVTEWDKYYTSPSLLGADFLNVYMNAIFFSDSGNGAATSFSDHASEWLDSGDVTKTPSGIYFNPSQTWPVIGNDGPFFSFYGYDPSYVGELEVSTCPLTVGDRHGFWYVGDGSFCSISGDYASSVSDILAYGVLGFRSVLMTHKPDHLDHASIGLFAHGGSIALDAKRESGATTDRHVWITTSKVDGTDDSGSIYIAAGLLANEPSIRTSITNIAGNIYLCGGIGTVGFLTNFPNRAAENISLWATNVDITEGLLRSPSTDFNFSSSTGVYNFGTESTDPEFKFAATANWTSVGATVFDASNFTVNSSGAVTLRSNGTAHMNLSSHRDIILTAAEDDDTLGQITMTAGDANYNAATPGGYYFSWNKGGEFIYIDTTGFYFAGASFKTQTNDVQFLNIPVGTAITHLGLTVDGKLATF